MVRVPARQVALNKEFTPFIENALSSAGIATATVSELVCKKTRARLSKSSRFHHLCRFIFWESEAVVLANFRGRTCCLNGLDLMAHAQMPAATKVFTTVRVSYEIK
jgi:hypothetical protein